MAERLERQPAPSARHRRTQQRIARRLAEIDFALPGSVVRRRVRCGKPGCRCGTDPDALHGPYLQWTRKSGGRTVTRLLTEEQAARYERWWRNARALRALVGELEALSVSALEAAEDARPPRPASRA